MNWKQELLGIGGILGLCFLYGMRTLDIQDKKNKGQPLNDGDILFDKLNTALRMTNRVSAIDRALNTIERQEKYIVSRKQTLTAEKQKLLHGETKIIQP